MKPSIYSMGSTRAGGLDLFQFSDHLPLAKEVLQEVSGTPTQYEILKCLTQPRSLTPWWR
jgi:hypothetical protein